MASRRPCAATPRSSRPISGRRRRRPRGCAESRWPPMIETQDLRAGYHRGLDILQGVSVSAGPGRITAVLGANGVGKSTLLKAICGFLKPTGGHVLLDGENITGIAPHRMVGHGAVYAPQQPGIF